MFIIILVLIIKWLSKPTMLWSAAKSTMSSEITKRSMLSLPKRSEIPLRNWRKQQPTSLPSSNNSTKNCQKTAIFCSKSTTLWMWKWLRCQKASKQAKAYPSRFLDNQSFSPRKLKNASSTSRSSSSTKNTHLWFRKWQFLPKSSYLKMTK